MSVKTYEIPYFIGLNQAKDENRLDRSFSPDAVNMDTEGGRLRVADGYGKLSPAKVPGRGSIDYLTGMRTESGTMPIVISGGRLYALIDHTWVEKYAYENISRTAEYDSVMVRIGSTDYLVIADGVNPLIKFDGEEVTPFGSEEGCSNIPVSYLTLYRGRLFAAGDRENPDRLYYSVLPGSGRTIEDWGYVEASPAVEGGHTEVGTIGGDPIVAIKALSNQLLIFKKNSLYRLIGDRPSNYTIEHIDANVLTTRQRAIAVYGDMLYFVTQDGLYYYNGVTARPCGDMRLIRKTMESANLSSCRAVIVRDKLYFNYTCGMDDGMIVYDLQERSYMRRSGFLIGDIAELGGKLILVNNRRLLYEFGISSSYDGEPIEAYWSTPLTDLGDKAAIKSPRMLYLRGSGELAVEVELDGKSARYRQMLSRGDECAVHELPLFNEGRCLRLRFSNINGKAFELSGGVELELGIRRRTE